MKGILKWIILVKENQKSVAPFPKGLEDRMESKADKRQP
jgi:hypothetical protein